MCFSNLPIEFDEAGNPYLTAEADDVDEVGGRPDSGCGCPGDVTLEAADPEALFEDILATMPSDVRDRVADQDGPWSTDGREGPRDGDDGNRPPGPEQTAEGD